MCQLSKQSRKRSSFIITFFLIVACQYSHAQKGSGTSMAPIISQSIEIIKYIENDLGQEIVRIEFDILSSTKSTIRTLSSGWTYGIYAFGDYSMADIDVRLYRKSGSSWVLVKSDATSDKTALVTIEPAYTGEYKIEISCYKFNQGYSVGHYGLIVFHE